MLNNIGKLEVLDLKDVFKHEAGDFTPWLAQEGLEILGQALGMSLNFVAREVSVGDFRADIKARDDDGNIIVIENQFNLTNHDHLGKMLTYVAGIEDVQTAIWITENVREEHRAVIDWLNNHTNENVNFFLVQVKAVQIGDSQPAPLFEVIAKPNQWTKLAKKRANSENIERTETQISNYKFFETLVGTQVQVPWNWQSPRDKNYLDINIGVPFAHLVIYLLKGTKANPNNYVQLAYYIDDDKSVFDTMMNYKMGLEKELGSLEWINIKENKSAKIVKTLDIDWMNTDTTNVEKLIHDIKPFYEVFSALSSKI